MTNITHATPCDILAFAAHPDDVELNCAGTLAAAVARGWKAGVVDFTRGELGSRGTPEIRDEEAAAAAQVLGLECRVNLGLPDGHLHDTDEARRLVVAAIRRTRPRVVIAPPLADHHADHVAVGEIVERSFYLAGVVKYAGADPPWRPRALRHYGSSQPERPHVVVDVSAVWEQRLAATRCFRSQFYREGSTEHETRIAHPGFMAAIEGRARHYGALVGVEFGEGFTMHEPLLADDPVALFTAEPWKKNGPRDLPVEER